MLKDAGVVDAGGAGYLLLLDAALHVVDGEPLPEPPTTPMPARRARRSRRSRAGRRASTASSTSASSATR